MQKKIGLTRCATSAITRTLTTNVRDVRVTITKRVVRWARTPESRATVPAATRDLTAIS